MSSLRSSVYVFSHPSPPTLKSDKGKGPSKMRVISSTVPAGTLYSRALNAQSWVHCDCEKCIVTVSPFSLYLDIGILHLLTPRVSLTSSQVDFRSLMPCHS